MDLRPAWVDMSRTFPEVGAPRFFHNDGIDLVDKSRGGKVILDIIPGEHRIAVGPPRTVSPHPHIDVVQLLPM